MIRKGHTQMVSFPDLIGDIAVERVMEAIASSRQRILLTLATGTGKTFIAFQIAWKPVWKNRIKKSLRPCCG